MRLCGSMLPHISDIYVYFNVNFNVFFKLIKVHLLVNELYIFLGCSVFDCIELRDFRNRDSVVEIGRLFEAFHVYVNNCSTRYNSIRFIYFCKLLYIFRMVTPPIIRSTYN